MHPVTVLEWRCCCGAAGRLVLTYQIVIGLAGYQLTAALLAQLPLNDVRSLTHPI